jgi:hypothetical protein
MSMPQNGYKYTYKVRMKQNSMSERLELMRPACHVIYKAIGWIRLM